MTLSVSATTLSLLGNQRHGFGAFPVCEPFGARQSGICFPENQMVIRSINGQRRCRPRARLRDASRTRSQSKRRQNGRTPVFCLSTTHPNVVPGWWVVCVLRVAIVNLVLFPGCLPIAVCALHLRQVTLSVGDITRRPLARATSPSSGAHQYQRLHAPRIATASTVGTAVALSGMLCGRCAQPVLAVSLCFLLPAFLFSNIFNVAEKKRGPAHVWCGRTVCKDAFLL